MIFLNFKRAIIWDSQEVSHLEGVERGGGWGLGEGGRGGEQM